MESPPLSVTSTPRRNSLDDLLGAQAASAFPTSSTHISEPSHSTLAPTQETSDETKEGEPPALSIENAEQLLDKPTLE